MQLLLEVLEELEELLISTDMGSLVAAKIIEAFKSLKFDKEVETTEIKETLANLIEQQLLEYLKLMFRITNCFLVISRIELGNS